jgi:GGDEF domain-containing protein
VEELVYVADAALYRAKAAGRNCLMIGTGNTAVIAW